MIQLKYKTISTMLQRTLWELITPSSEKDSAAGQQNLQLSLSFTELPATLKYLLLVKNFCLLLNCMSSLRNNISFSRLLFKVTPWFHYLRCLNSPKSLLAERSAIENLSPFGSVVFKRLAQLPFELCAIEFVCHFFPTK